MGEASKRKCRNRTAGAVQDMHQESKNDDYLAEASLVLMLVITAMQGMELSAWLVAPCWILVLIFLIYLIWRKQLWRAWAKIIATPIAIFLIGVPIYKSFSGPIIPTARPEIYFFEKARIPAIEVPFTDVSQAQQLLLTAFVAQRPHIVPVVKIGNRIVINVVLRNPTKIPMRNATVSIISDVPIRGETNGARTFSDKEVSYETRTVRPYSELSEEYFHSVSFETPPEHIVHFIVTVESDNSKPYTGLQSFEFIYPPDH